MPDPYNLQAALAAIAKAQKMAQLAKGIGKAAQHVQAGSTQGLSTPSYGGGGSSGGGVGAAPVSTLAAYASNPVAQDLIAKGIIKEGMGAEQINALLAIQGMSANVPIDIAALTNMLKAQYEDTSGDILGAGAEWMQELYGTNYDPNDPNAALFAQDPIFSTYAGGLAQMDETSDQMLQTDLSWFTEQGAAQQAYYDQLLTDVATYGLPVQDGSGGGGGGGGGGYGGGDSGGGSGSAGDGLAEWDVNKTKANSKDTLTQRAASNARYYNPDFWQGGLAQFSDPADQELANEWIAQGNAEPLDVVQFLYDVVNDNTANIESGNLAIEGNTAWEAGSPEMFNQLMQEYQSLSGRGDDPSTSEVEHFYVPEGSTAPVGNALPITAVTPDLQERYRILQQMYNQTYGAGTIDLPRDPNFVQNLFSQLNSMQPTSQVSQNTEGSIPTGGDMPEEQMTDFWGNVVGTAANPNIPLPSDNIPPNFPDGRPMLPSYNFDEGTYQQGYVGDLPYDPENPTAGQELIDSAHHYNNDLPPTSAEFAAGQAEAMDQARRVMDDPQALSFYLEDEFPNLSRAQQASVDELFSDNGINIPATIYHPAGVSNDPSPVVPVDNQAASILSSALQAHRRRQRTPEEEAQMLFNNPATAAMAQSSVLEANSPIYGGNLRPDLLQAMIDADAKFRMQARNQFPGSNADWNENTQPGDWYDPSAPSPEDIADLEHQQQVAQILMDWSQQHAPEFQMNTVQDYTVDQAASTASVTNSADTSDPDALDLTMYGDPNDYTLEELDPVPNGGSFGESRAFLPMFDWQMPVAPKLSATKSYKGLTSRNKSAGVQNAVKAAANKKLAAMTGLGGKKKVGGRGFF